MPKKSGLTNRDIVNHGNGKGDKTRVTDVKAYRENFDEINWGLRKGVLGVVIWPNAQARFKALREIEDEEHAWRMGL